MSYKVTGAFTYHTIENVYESPFLDLKVDLTDPVKINVELIIKTGDTILLQLLFKFISLNIINSLLLIRYY